MNGEVWALITTHYRRSLGNFVILFSNGLLRIWSYLYVEPPDISSVFPLNVSVELPVFCERQDLDPR
jgi:hypothetical protein